MVKQSDPKIVKPEDVSFEDSNINPDPILTSNASQSSSNPQTQLLTGLEGVNEDAIKQFIEKVGDFYSFNFSRSFPKDCYHFFAYFLKPIYQTDGSGYYIGISEMHNKRNLVEAIKVVFGPDILKTDMLTSVFGIDLQNLGNSPADFERIVNIIPEYGSILNSGILSYKFAVETKYRFCQLFKLPPMGKTFFSGLIHKKGLEDIQGDQKLSKKVLIPVTTRDIIEYGLSIGIKNISEYVKMLSGE